MTSSKKSFFALRQNMLWRMRKRIVTKQWATLVYRGDLYWPFGMTEVPFWF